MLHQDIAPADDAQRVLDQAIEDAANDVGELNRQRRLYAAEPHRTKRSQQAAEYIGELEDRIRLIADRAGIELFQLVELVEISSRSTIVRHPVGEGAAPVSIRHLQIAVTDAIAEENAARTAWDQARHAYGKARTARRAAEAAYAAYSAQPLVIDQ